ncbi:MAG: phosphoenolpyruvate--protein phosphotransferase [Candidatus Limnocylindrales bacterium]
MTDRAAAVSDPGVERNGRGARRALIGQPGSPGTGVGRLLVVASAEPAIRTPVMAAIDPTVERRRLLAAMDLAADQLEALARGTAATVGGEVGAIFEAQALFARDPGLLEPALAAVDAGAGAAEAIEAAAAAQADTLAAVDDAYFRERAVDVRDVGRRVAAIIDGRPTPVLWRADGTPAIVIAEDLDPSLVATLRRELVAGIGLQGGAATGHAAIVARALGIPLVLGLGRALDGVATDVEALVDGSTGRLIVHPTAEDVVAPTAAESTSAVFSSPTPTGLATVGVSANVGSVLEATAAARAGADGIGLVRTELLFLARSRPPSVGEQRATYARILEAVGGRPVVFRTLDIGGDKPAAFMAREAEANPALGVRGVRLGLRQPALLDDQLTALLEAAAGGELQVMVPMVATVEELDEVRHRFERLRASLVEAGRPTPATLRLGAMIEIPSAAIMADRLAESADFLSIGTNDLIQYLLAADRTNPALADLASVLQPAALRMIDIVVRAARAHDRHVAVCGEAAADPRAIPLLIGLGVHELSVAPSSIEAVRRAAADVDATAARALVDEVLQARSLAEVDALVDADRGTRARGT